MHARENLAAAATLALAMGVVMAGTIWQADAARDGSDCGGPACQDVAGAAGPSSPSRGWEASLYRAARRVEDGFLLMAGMPRPR